MAEALDVLEQRIFGSGRGASHAPASVDVWRQQLGLDTLEQQHNLPAGLMTSVLRQESGGDPRVKSSAGAQGLFQFMPATARQYKIDPFDPQQAAPAAAKELSTLYKKYGGDVDRTLAAWNWGQGNVDRKGFANRPAETRGFIANVKRFLSPASAEAAPLPQQPQDMDALEQRIFGGMEQQVFGAQKPLEAPRTPPAGPSTSSQGPLAPRLSLGDPREAATEPEARATIEAMRARQTPALERFLALPSIAQLTPAERAQVQAEFQALPVDQQEQVIQQEVPQDLQQAMAKPQESYPRRVGETPRPGEKRLGIPDEAPLEEGITKPSTMIPLLMGTGIPGLVVPGVGGKAGMRLVPEAWRWVGRVGGETVTQTAAELGGRAIETGKAPDWQEIAATTAWNLAPQAIEEGGRATFRNILRSGQGARTILSDVAAQESKGLGRRVFHPQDEQVLSKMFEDVKASGVKLDIDPVTDLMTSLKPEQRQVLLRDVKAISSPLAAALQKTGQPGALRLTGWDIGDLQTLRSDLIKRSQAVRTPERQDLINEMRMAVDDAIERGIAVGSTAAGGNPETLRAAQAGWRRLRQSDDLQALVTKHTNYSPNLQYQDLNLAALKKSLDGTNPLGRKVAGSLGKAETAALQQELTTLAKRYPFVKVPNTVMNFGGKAGLPGAAYLAITGNMPGAAVAASSAVVALALQSPKAMSYFRSAIVNGKGRLSSNDVAAIVNAVRQVSDVEEPG